GYVQCCHCPNRSQNLTSTCSALFFFAKSKTSFGDGIAFALPTAAVKRWNSTTSGARIAPESLPARERNRRAKHGSHESERTLPPPPEMRDTPSQTRRSNRRRVARIRCRLPSSAEGPDDRTAESISTAWISSR